MSLVWFCLLKHSVWSAYGVREVYYWTNKLKVLYRYETRNQTMNVKEQPRKYCFSMLHEKWIKIVNMKCWTSYWIYLRDSVNFPPPREEKKKKSQFCILCGAKGKKKLQWVKVFFIFNALVIRWKVSIWEWHQVLFHIKSSKTTYFTGHVRTFNYLNVVNSNSIV